ncbi:MAG: hypothetical protein M9947_01865 [Thermomicrobiales bacterium]|nr:hypothetical protein [Thermomicrobiales bacterium]
MSADVTARRSGLLARLVTGSIAGALAGIAYLVAAGIDNRVSGRRLYDLLLLGRPFVSSPRRANMLGLLLHAGNSAGLGALYGIVAEPRLPGPPVIKGLTFVTIEGTVLYPILALEEHHPAVAADEIGPYWTWKSFLWNWPRHVAYGAVLGWVLPRLRNR